MDISDLRMISLAYKSDAGSETLSMSVWKGIFFFRINSAKDNRVIFAKKWKRNEIYAISKFMAEFSKDTKEASYVFNTYDPEAKSFKLDYVMIFHRDDRRVNHIIIKTNGQTFDFPIKGIATISTGTGDFPPHVRSNNEWGYIISFLKDTVPMQMQLSNFPNNDTPGTSPQRNNYRKPSNQSTYSGQSEFKERKNLPPDDDLFD